MTTHDGRLAKLERLTAGRASRRDPQDRQRRAALAVEDGRATLAQYGDAFAEDIEFWHRSFFEEAPLMVACLETGMPLDGLSLLTAYPPDQDLPEG